MSKVVSLQTRLIKTSLLSSIAAGSIALLFFIMTSTYHTMQVQDEIMDEISDMLLIADLTSNSGQQVDELSDEFDIQYQLRHKHQVLTQSEDFHFDENAHILFASLDEHYGFVWHNGHLWRSYTAQDQQTNMQAFVLQPLTERFEKLLNSIIFYSSVLLILWIMQWLILHFLIKRQFKVINQLSTQIAEKHADDLKPIRSQASELKELQPIIFQLNNLLQRLDHALVAEQRFTADASHELRSPLSAIQMRLQLLQRKYPNMENDFKPIQADIKRGTHVLENLLLLARLDPENAENLPKTVFNVEDLIQELLLSLKPVAEEKNLHLEFKTFTHELSKTQIYANRDLIFICFRNLIDNAIRYSPTNADIYLELENHQNCVTFAVKNGGEILDTDTTNRLGERFYRALGTQTQGSGLGLSICKKIIHLHHGQIIFSALPEGGLQVRCILPVHNITT